MYTNPYVQQTKSVVMPICGVAYTVKFDPVCPYSNCKDCEECLKDEDDQYYVGILVNIKQYNYGIS